MLKLDIKGRPLLLPAGATASIEHINPLFADGVEDSFSLPIEVPARNNEIALDHVHQLPLTRRAKKFTGASLGHHGVPLYSGTLHVLSTTPNSVRASFSIDGFVAEIKDITLPQCFAGRQLDILTDLAPDPDLPSCFRRYATGGACQFPMHFNPKLYGDSNPDWYPNASDYSPSTAYQINALIKFTEIEDHVERTYIYQCTDTTSPGQNPTNTPSKWRRAAFGIVNAWDRNSNAFYFNDDDGNFYTLVPWFYLKWVLTNALQHIGYTAVGDFMDDPVHHEFVIPNTTTIDRATNRDSVHFFRASNNTPVYFSGSPTVENLTAFRLPASDDSTPPNNDPNDVWDTSQSLFLLPANEIWQFRIRVKITDPPPALRFLRANIVHGTTIVDQSPLAEFNPSGWTIINVGPPFSSPTPDLPHHFSITGLSPGLNHVWPTNPNHGFSQVVIEGWRIESTPSVVAMDRLISPERHVPDMPLIDFIMAIADAFNLEVRPDVNARLVSLSYKERILQDYQRNRSDHSHRLIDDVEVDHQRAIPGINLKWNIETSSDPESAFNGIDQYPSEADLLPPFSINQRALLTNTRKYLKARFNNGTFYWTQVGYYVPDHTVGDRTGARNVHTSIRPLHMEELTLDGKKYLMPVLDAAGTSAWFHNEGERSTFWLTMFHPASSSDGVVANIPGARSWGYGWNPSDRSAATLLWDQHDEHLPGLYQRHWKRWANMLTTAEPVTMDLLVDNPFLMGHQWKRILHIHGQDYIMEKLPVTYGTDRGPLISRGAYLFRLRAAAAPVPPPPPIPDDPCAEAAMWPSEIVDVDIFSQAGDGAQQNFEVNPPALGTRILLLYLDETVHINTWSQHTGEIATYVGPGEGLDGGAWVFEALPIGTLVRWTAFPDSLMVILQAVGGSVYNAPGRSGRFAAQYLMGFPDGIVPAPPAALLPVDSFNTNSELGNWAAIYDPCRRCTIQWSEDDETYVDVPMEPITEQQAFTLLPLELIPEGASSIRFKWTRGTHIQGYSEPAWF